MDILGGWHAKNSKEQGVSIWDQSFIHPSSIQHHIWEQTTQNWEHPILTTKEHLCVGVKEKRKGRATRAMPLKIIEIGLQFPSL